MLTIDKLSKTFTTANGTLLAVDNIDLEIAAGEICVLLGPLGCGKTSVLKMINRLIEPSSGKVYIAGKDAAAAEPVTLRRSIGYAFRGGGLFPHLTVEQNIGLVPQLMGWDTGGTRRRIDKLLSTLGLEPTRVLPLYPCNLTRGQTQRVAIARALAADPPVLLLDEPFADLDRVDREAAQDEFLNLQKMLGKTALLVSHDIDEAIRLADKIAVLRDGRLEQFGPPDSILAHPSNAFVARFVGSDRILKRLRLVTVGEAMFANAPSVRAEDPLEQAVALMEEHDYEHIVMVGPRGRARGSIGLPVAREKHGTVGDHRSALSATINVKDNLRVAMSAMFTHDQTWLACVDDDGYYRGYLTQQGITHLLAETYRDTDPDE